MGHFGIALFFLINVFWVNAIVINPEVQKKVEKTRIIAYNKLRMRESKIEIEIEIKRIVKKCQCHVENLSSLGAFILTYNNKTHLESTHQTVDFLIHPEIVDVEDQVITIHNQKIPEDPSFNRQWNLNGGEWSLNAHINAGNGWWEYMSDVIGGNPDGPRPVIVAVVDSGIDYNHNDLKRAMWTNPGEIPDNKQDDDNNGKVDDVYGYDFNNNDDSDPMDKTGHGTHCAGIIGAKENNGIGIAGITSFSHGKVKIMAIKALSDHKHVVHTSSSDFKQALNYAIENGATISSNSWGADDKSFSKNDLQAWKSHFENNPEHLFVFSAGNKNRNINDTSHLEFMMCGVKNPNLLCVASSNLSDTISVNSNYGKDYVHVFAPGYYIYSTTPNNHYDVMSGTSMACPHVAGLAALIKTLRPNLNGQQLREAIEKNVQKNKNYENRVSSGGKVDMEKTIRAFTWFRTQKRTCSAVKHNTLLSGCPDPTTLDNGRFLCLEDHITCHVVCDPGYYLEITDMAGHSALKAQRFKKCLGNNWTPLPTTFKCTLDCDNRDNAQNPACAAVLSCRGGATLLSTSPHRDMVLCKDKTESTCQKDFETLCPARWNLCTPGQFNNRNDDWDFNWRDAKAGDPMGVIYCGIVSGYAGHYIMKNPVLNRDDPLNCAYTSSQPGCDAYAGFCQHKDKSALCCAPRNDHIHKCGDGQVQHEEEDCDDGNISNDDDCLNTCTWKTPMEHGMSGCG